MSPSQPAAAATFVHGLAACILDPTTGDAALREACDALHGWALGLHPDLSRTPIGLPSGLAIAPVDAARCVLDAPRTACLARALDASIAHQLARNPDARVQVLYAGCGPFAPLALIAATRWRHARLRIDLLDVHAASLRSARALFDQAGLAGLLGEAICADAVRWRRPTQAPRPAILVAEVMQRALACEPQLAVVANLLPQCAGDADLVPAKITVDAALASLEALFGGGSGVVEHALGAVLELSAAALPVLCRHLQNDPTRLPEVVLPVPADAPQGCHAVLRTRIDAGHGHTLAQGDSGLTQPLPLLEPGRLAPGDVLKLHYRLTPEPGFECVRAPA
jgi:hypothetical protein